MTFYLMVPFLSFPRDNKNWLSRSFCNTYWTAEPNRFGCLGVSCLSLGMYQKNIIIKLLISIKPSQQVIALIPAFGADVFCNPIWFMLVRNKWEWHWMTLNDVKIEVFGWWFQLPTKAVELSHISSASSWIVRIYIFLFAFAKNSI